jgi:signal recognition particle GTPase
LVARQYDSQLKTLFFWHAHAMWVVVSLSASSLQVGAALSMVYRSKVPVVFVGTGQKYTNLKRLNVDAVIEALFK